MCNWDRFCKILVGMLFLPCFFTVLLFEWALYRINEQKVGTVEAIEIYTRGKALYGSALSGDVSFLKFGIVERLQPEILAIGSSRVMEFRKSFFGDTTFYTMGGLCDSIDDLSNVFQMVSEKYIPRIIILEVSWDWLNPNYSLHKIMERPFMEKNPISRRVYLYRRFYERIRGSEKVRKQLLKPDIELLDKIGARKTVGLMASTDYRGFREDGSFQYGNAILNLKPLEERLRDTHERIQNANKRFEEAYDLDQKELSKLQTLIQEITKSGCHVIVFLPPFPNEIYQTLLSSEKHKTFMEKYEQKMKALCNKERIAFFDFSNMAWIGSPDEEALDGFHGSERTYGRMMLRFLEDKELAPYVNAEYIRERLEKSDSPIQLLRYDE